MVWGSLKYRGLQPFGPRVVLAEITRIDSPIIAILAYICHSSGEGLVNVMAALQGPKGRSPCVLLGTDRNGHSPCWGPNLIATNPVGALIEDFIVTYDLDIVNTHHRLPTFASDLGDFMWIDATFAT